MKTITMSETDYETINKCLTALRNSCVEGRDGTWDITTDEGLEGFDFMVWDCEWIATKLGIELPEYQSDSGE